MWTKSRDGKTLMKCGAVTAALARPGTASATTVATPAARPAVRARLAAPRAVGAPRTDCLWDEALEGAFVTRCNTGFLPPGLRDGKGARAAESPALSERRCCLSTSPRRTGTLVRGVRRHPVAGPASLRILPAQRHTFRRQMERFRRCR